MDGGRHLVRAEEVLLLQRHQVDIQQAHQVLQGEAVPSVDQQGAANQWSLQLLLLLLF